MSNKKPYSIKEILFKVQIFLRFNLIIKITVIYNRLKESSISIKKMF
jgi:hypothetical protein